MASVKCECSYEDFVLCVPKTSHVMYCMLREGNAFTCAATVDSIEHIYHGHRPANFDLDYPKAAQVRGIQIV